VGATVIAVRDAIAVAVPACMTVVGAAVVTVVIAMARDVAGRGRCNNDHVRPIAAVSRVRLRLRRRAECRQQEHRGGAECKGNLLHRNSFEPCIQEFRYWGQTVKDR
jgi:hypothetical protein